MSEADERSKRKLGDATRARIDDLADGWSLPPQPAARSSGSTIPATPTAEAAGGRPVRQSQPPPLPGARPKGPSQPPASNPVSLKSTLGSASPAKPGLPRPSTWDELTVKADAPDASKALEGSDLSDFLTDTPAKEPLRRPPARADESLGAMILDAPRQTGAKPRERREIAAFPRAPGLLGDVRYVATVLVGGLRARGQLRALDEAVAAGRVMRNQALTKLGMDAVEEDDLDQTTITRARERLTEIEERRMRHADATADADKQTATVVREQQEVTESIDRDLADAAAELARLRDQLAPLEKAASATRRRIVEVRATLGRLDAKLRITEGNQSTAEDQRGELGTIAAELATLRADRNAVLADQGKVVDELDGLLPQIAGLEAEISDAESRIARLRASRDESAKRASELIAAIDSRKVVEKRAVADAESAKQLALEELGHRVYVDRPDPMRWALAPVEQLDVELAEKQRQALELRELLSNIERAALLRGAALWLLALALMVGALVFALG